MFTNYFQYYTFTKSGTFSLEIDPGIEKLIYSEIN